MISATLSLGDAETFIWDAVVLGAGPSGSIAACTLALGGRSVLLVDKSRFPRWKVCGCSLNMRALAVLDTMGLGSLPAEEGAIAARAFEVAANKIRRRFLLPGGVTLSREALDAALARAAIRAGAQFLPQVSGALADVADDSRVVQLRGADRTAAVRARMVVVATGLGSRLLTGTEEYFAAPAQGSRIGAGAIAPCMPAGYETGTIYMACGKAGYVGFTALEGGRLDLGAALDADAVRDCGGLAGAASAILDEAGFRGLPDVRSLEWRGTPALTRRASQIAAHRLLVVGDAAGYVEPFTGEGMAWALSGGAALGRIASRALPHWDKATEDEWRTCYRGIVTRRQWVCKGLAALLRRPRLTIATAYALAIAPGLATSLIRQINAKAVLATRSSV